MISLGQKDDVDRSDVDANGMLYDILDAPLQPKPQKSIFFVATHKCENDVVTLNARYNSLESFCQFEIYLYTCKYIKTFISIFI